MLRMFVLPAVAAVALTAPAAHADDPVADCGFNAVQQQDTTGPYYEGVMYGYVVHDGPVTIRCYIKVNGVPGDSTDLFGVGVTAAATAGTVSYLANAVDMVEVCAEATTYHGTFNRCDDTTTLD